MLNANDVIHIYTDIFYLFSDLASSLHVIEGVPGPNVCKYCSNVCDRGLSIIPLVIIKIRRNCGCYFFKKNFFKYFYSHLFGIFCLFVMHTTRTMWHSREILQWAKCIQHFNLYIYLKPQFSYWRWSYIIPCYLLSWYKDNKFVSWILKSYIIS